MESLLGDIARGGAPRASDPVGAERAAVLAHLRDICGTLRGSVLIAPDLGFEDATHLFLEYPRSEEEARSRLEAVIRRYEPRLTGVVVEAPRKTDRAAMGPDLKLRFVVSAKLLVDGREVPLQFTSVLRDDKLFAIE